MQKKFKNCVLTLTMAAVMTVMFAVSAFADTEVSTATETMMEEETYEEIKETAIIEDAEEKDGNGAEIASAYTNEKSETVKKENTVNTLAEITEAEESAIESGEEKELVRGKEPEYVCKIGNTEYESIAQAVEAAENGATIQVTVEEIDLTGLGKGVTVKGLVEEGELKTKVTKLGSVKNITLKDLEIPCVFNQMNLDGFTADNCTFNNTGSVFYLCVITGDNTATLKNCRFEHSGSYAINIDQNGGNLICKNCDITGTVGIGGSIKSAKFEGCNFLGKGKSSKCNINIYNKAEFTDCSFTDAYTSGGSRGILMVNDSNAASVVMKDCKVVDGTHDDIVKIIRQDYKQGIVEIDAVGDKTNGYTSGTFVATAADTNTFGTIVKVASGSRASKIEIEDGYYYEIDEVDPEQKSVGGKNIEVGGKATVMDVDSSAMESEDAEEIAEELTKNEAAFEAPKGLDSAIKETKLTSLTSGLEGDVYVLLSVKVNLLDCSDEEESGVTMSFEATPQAEVFKDGVKQSEDDISNSDLNGKPITFRIPIPSRITTEYARVLHKEGGVTIGEYYLKIKQEGEYKYVEVTVTRFSTFEIEFTDTLPESKNTSSGGGGGGRAVFTSAAWVKDAKGWRYRLKSGSYVSGKWMEIDNPYAADGQEKKSWFYFNSEGYMVTGWFTDTNGYKYYLNPLSDNTLGKMVHGTVVIDGKTCVFSEAHDGHYGHLVETK